MMIFSILKSSLLKINKAHPPPFTLYDTQSFAVFRNEFYVLDPNMHTHNYKSQYN